MAARNPLPDLPHTNHDLAMALRRQLQQRRELLASAVARSPEMKIMQLLQEVDSALGRMDVGRYGVCDVCQEAVEEDRLLSDPLVRVCLCELNSTQQGALEKDLELAARIQARLLPQKDFRCDGWQVAYQYRPLSVVSGDYCDLMIGPDESLYFLLGDVAGKGVAASVLMSNLSAIFRALIPLGLPLNDLMERANRIFTGSTLPNQYATLICGRAKACGELELCNAGHVSALVVAGEEVSEVGSSGMPIGLFSEEKFSVAELQLAPDSSLVLFTDGVSEARREDEDYGYERIAAAVVRGAGLCTSEAVANVLGDLDEFLSHTPVYDDQTLMLLQRCA
jgi:sigma-B regulation protein RsbU (phosphoserine phosphatase)